MRISDWSSDVCSSDLAAGLILAGNFLDLRDGWAVCPANINRTVAIANAEFNALERGAELGANVLRRDLAAILVGRLLKRAIGRIGAKLGDSLRKAGLGIVCRNGCCRLDRKSTRLNSSH